MNLVRCWACQNEFDNSESQETFTSWDSKPTCKDCIADAVRLASWLEHDRRTYSRQLLRTVHLLHHKDGPSPGCEWCREGVPA